MWSFQLKFFLPFEGNETSEILIEHSNRVFVVTTHHLLHKLLFVQFKLFTELCPSCQIAIHQSNFGWKNASVVQGSENGLDGSLLLSTEHSCADISGNLGSSTDKTVVLKRTGGVSPVAPQSIVSFVISGIINPHCEGMYLFDVWTLKRECNFTLDRAANATGISVQ